MILVDLARVLGPLQALKIGLIVATRREEAVLKLPDGMRITIDLSQLLRTLNNILHVYYYMDYAFVPDVIPDEGWRVIDAGAYLGAYTLWAAGRVGSGGEVVALEPHPRSRELLWRTITLNGLRNVRILPYALSTRDGVGVLHSPGYRALASLRRSHVEYFCGEVVEEHEVECVSLRTLLDVLGRGEIDLLKLDIEGLEYDVLKDSIDALGRIRRMVIEVHLDACSIPKLDRLLRDNGFETTIKLDSCAENQAFIAALRKA